MHQKATTQTKAQIRLSESPTARKPRSKRACFPLFPMLAKHQGDLVRSWLAHNAGHLCIAIGWLLAFAIVFVPKTTDFATTIMELGILGASCFGFGIAWIIQGEMNGGNR